MYINSNLLQAKTLTKRAVESLTEEDYRANYLAASKSYLDAADEVDDERIKISLIFMSVSCTRMASQRKISIMSKVNVKENSIRIADICDIVANERAVFSVHRKRIADLKKVESITSMYIFLSVL